MIVEDIEACHASPQKVFHEVAPPTWLYSALDQARWVDQDCLSVSCEAPLKPAGLVVIVGSLRVKALQSGLVQPGPEGEMIIYL